MARIAYQLRSNTENIRSMPAGALLVESLSAIARVNAPFAELAPVEMPAQTAHNAIRIIYRWLGESRLQPSVAAVDTIARLHELLGKESLSAENRELICDGVLVWLGYTLAVS